MLNNKKVIISIILIVCILASSIPAFASEPGGVSGVWYAPKGGTWNVNNSIPSTGILRPRKIVYITYDELALIQASKLTSSDLSSLATIARDQGITALSAWLAKKLGSTVANKFIPYIGYATLAYDCFNALSSYITDSRFAKAISNKHGIAISTGTSYNALGCFPYTAYEDWTSSYVYNPSGCVGTFTSN